MKKVIKNTLIIGTLLTLLLGTFLSLIIYNPKLVQSPLQYLIYNQTGYQFTTDEISLELSPATLTIYGLSLFNMEWSTDKPLLELKHIEVKIDLVNLIKSENRFWSALIDDANVRIEQDTQGVTNWDTVVLQEKVTSDEPLALKDYLRFNNIEVKNSTIKSIKSSDKNTLIINRFKLSNEENIINLEGVGLYDNEPINLIGNVDINNIGDDDQNLVLSLKGNGLGIDIESNGTVKFSNWTNSKVTTHIKINNLDKLEKLTATKFQKISPIDLTIKLFSEEHNKINIIADGHVKKETIKLKGYIKSASNIASKSSISVEVSGLDSTIKLDGVADFEKLEKVDLHATASIKNLVSYGELLSQDFPDISEIKTNFNLSKDKNLIKLNDIDFVANNASLSGDASYDTKELHFSADLETEILNLTPFFEKNGAMKIDKEEDDSEEIDQISSFNTSAFFDKKDSSFSSDIKFSSKLLIFKEHEFGDLNLEVNLNNELLQINKFVSKYKRVVGDKSINVFSTEPISIVGNVKLPSESNRNMDIDVTLDDQDMRLAANGSVEISDALTGQLTIEGNAKELRTFSVYTQRDLKSFGPATLNLVANFKDRSVELKPFAIETKENDLTGQTLIDWSTDKISINGELQSQRLDLNQFRFGTESDFDANDEVQDSDKIFSNTIINWDWLNNYNIDVGVNITQLSLNKTSFRSIISRAKLAKGKLVIEPFDAILANGGIRGVLSIEKQSPGVKITSNIVGLNITPADFGEPDKGVISGGNTDVEIDLAMKGASAHDLAASLNGEFVLEMRKAKIKNDLLERLGSDIFLKTLSMLNPFVKEDEYTNLDCAAARFVAEDGELISKNQIAIETSKVEIVAGGIVNLDTEQLVIGFTPVAKKGLGVNIGNLVKFVRLGGTLLNPIPEADPAGMLKSGAAFGAAISTGGLSLLVDGLFKRLTTAGTACNHIFEE